MCQCRWGHPDRNCAAGVHLRGMMVQAREVRVKAISDSEPSGYSRATLQIFKATVSRYLDHVSGVNTGVNK